MTKPKRPEKKECTLYKEVVHFALAQQEQPMFDAGYNQAIEEFEAYLPSKEEIKEIIRYWMPADALKSEIKGLAKAIYRRISE